MNTAMTLLFFLKMPTNDKDRSAGLENIKKWLVLTIW